MSQWLAVMNKKYYVIVPSARYDFWKEQSSSVIPSLSGFSYVSELTYENFSYWFFTVDTEDVLNRMIILANNCGFQLVEGATYRAL
jgi:hypothetical protein